MNGIVADFSPPPIDGHPNGPPGQIVRVEESPDAAIPDDQPDGVTRTLTVSQAGSCTRLTVNVDIRHPFIGDLQVSLIPPGGAPIVLHDRTGGGTDNLVQSYGSEDIPALAAVVGRQIGGSWTLKIADLARRDVGSLSRWGLEIGVGTASSVIRAETSPGLAIPDNKPAGVTSTLAIADSGMLQAAKIGVNITHTYIGDLRVELVPPSGRGVLLHDRTGGGAHDVITTFDTTSNSALAVLIGQPIRGEWVLKVSDNAGLDVGRLNQWRLELTAAP